MRNQFHIDHVFPRSLFTRKHLSSLRHADGTPPTSEWIEMAIDQANRLANLQLLEGPINESKQATLPLTWATQHFPDEDARGLYLAGHDLHGISDDLLAFPTFYEQRKLNMLKKLRHLLGVSEPVAETPNDGDGDVPATDEFVQAPPATGAPG